MNANANAAAYGCLNTHVCDNVSRRFVQTSAQSFVAGLNHMSHISSARLERFIALDKTHV
jgi:hypothetical protein